MRLKKIKNRRCEVKGKLSRIEYRALNLDDNLTNERLHFSTDT